jgi:hypothetical protein
MLAGWRAQVPRVTLHGIVINTGRTTTLIVQTCTPDMHGSIWPEAAWMSGSLLQVQLADCSCQLLTRQ